MRLSISSNLIKTYLVLNCKANDIMANQLKVLHVMLEHQKLNIYDL